MAEDATPLRRKGKAKGCPICGKPVVEKFKPFCSPRCADVDLHRWLSEGYRVPTAETAEEPAEDAED
jgi:endogenous inhibitor of DNA gyrase (YacG/DUF329 family)